MFDEDRYATSGKGRSEETFNEKVIEFGKQVSIAYSNLEDENTKLKSENKSWKESFCTMKNSYENIKAHYEELKSDFDRVMINYKDLKEKSLNLEKAYLEQQEELKQAKEKEEEDRSWFAEMIRWFNKTRNDEVSKLKAQRNSLIKYYGNTSVHKVKQSEVAKIVELSEARISQIINTPDPNTDKEN